MNLFPPPLPLEKHPVHFEEIQSGSITCSPSAEDALHGRVGRIGIRVKVPSAHWELREEGKLTIERIGHIWERTQGRVVWWGVAKLETQEQWRRSSWWANRKFKSVSQTIHLGASEWWHPWEWNGFQECMKN